MTGSRGWLGVVSCFVLFMLVFLSQKMRIVSASLDEGLWRSRHVALFIAGYGIQLSLA